MHREYLVWQSSHLARPMEFLWFGHSGRPVLFFPTSMGRFFECEDNGLVTALTDKVDAGDIQLICVDSVDRESWYNRSLHPGGRIYRQGQYDAYLRHEMVPYIRHRAGRSDLALFGASFGAYHAANFASRHPELVRKSIMFSGFFDVQRYLDGYWDENCYFHCPSANIPNMDESWCRRLASVEWIVATGEYDHLAQCTRDFSSLLSSRGIPNHAEIWQGVFGHDWPWWREHLRRFVP